MKREEIHQVLYAFLDPNDPHYPGHRNRWRGDPVEAVRKVVAQKSFEWSEQQITVVGTKLAHQSSEGTLEWLENTFKAEEMIQDAIRSVRPAYLSTLVMHNVTFYLGVTLVLAAIYASFEGYDLFSAILGSVGFGTIIFLFFRQPIRGVQRSIGNLIQLEIIYNSYTKQLGYWKAFQHTDDIAIKREVIREIESCTRKTIQLVQEYCERDESACHGEVKDKV
jgi:hypothetical protein